MHGIWSLADEFKNCSFPDERLRKRAMRIAERVEREPSWSFPRAFADPSQLEAVYRFVGNERVDLDDIVSGHIANTLKRLSSKKRCLAIHDTTSFSFEGEREDLGTVDRAQEGFYAHVCLCVSAEGHREPVGLLAIDTWTRDEKKGKRTTRERKAESDLESGRWAEQSLDVEGLVKSTELIHVEDREADIYESLETRIAHDMHFIVRAASSKVVLTNAGTENILDYARTLSVVTTREIHLSARKAKHSTLRPNAQHPPRKERDSRIEIRAGKVRLRKPLRSGACPELELNAVHVLEMDAPRGEKPVEWLLLTTEPIATVADVETVVDNYRARWLIEEYFKALKTGCKYEERQLESLHALLNALGIFAVMAWRLLQLRFLERTASDAPATTIASSAEIAILEKEARMPPRATVREFLLRLARFGGHLPQNGPPGLLILWRALSTLLQRAQGFELALKM
ncbi:MAG: IS4 family transposase [Archangium sp.]